MCVVRNYGTTIFQDNDGILHNHGKCPKILNTVFHVFYDPAIRRMMERAYCVTPVHLSAHTNGHILGRYILGTLYRVCFVNKYSIKLWSYWILFCAVR